MNKDTIKRVGLYFNLENPIEKQMWEYINKGRRKSDTIKRLIENEINKDEKNLSVEIKGEKNTICKKEIENCEGINF